MAASAAITACVWRALLSGELLKRGFAWFLVLVARYMALKNMQIA